MIISVPLPIKISTGLLAKYIVRVSSKSLTEIKLFFNIKWIFYSVLLLLVVLVLSLLLLLLLLFNSIIGCDHLSNFLNMVTLRYSLGAKFSYLSALLVISI